MARLFARREGFFGRSGDLRMTYHSECHMACGPPIEMKIRSGRPVYYAFGVERWTSSSSG